jgi:hypothetical protein
MTGPIERFILMRKSQNYKNMLNHREHKIEPVLQTNGRSPFAVFITTSDNKKTILKWELIKVPTSEFSGSWIT